MSNAVLMALWLDLCLVVCILHLSTNAASSSKANIKLIVNLWSPLCYVLVPLNSKLQRACLLKSLTIELTLPCLFCKMSSPP
jgi:hypothetical protein